MAEDTRTSNATLATVDKALRVLDLFQRRQRLTLSDTARELGVGLSAAHRLLASLLQAGFLERDPITKTYRLGLKVFLLASRVETVSWVQEKIKPFMTTLVNELGETCILTVRKDLVATSVERVECSNSIRVGVEIGTVMPLHAGASARILLAYAPQYIVDEVLSKPLEVFTPNTPQDPEALRQRLELIRERGYETSVGEVNPGVFAAGVPLFWQNSPMQAGLSVVAPSSRCTEQKIADIIDKLISTAHVLQAGSTT